MSKISKYSNWQSRFDGNCVRSETGNALMEFALLIPVLALIVAAIVHFGLLIVLAQTLFNTANEGAGIARNLDALDLQNRTSIVTSVEASLANQINQSALSAILSGNAAVTLSPPVSLGVAADGCPDDSVTATVQAMYQVSYLKFLGFNNMLLSRSVSMPHGNTICLGNP